MVWCPLVLSCLGSAFCIAGERLLTNAHVVRDYTTVRVRRHGGSEKFKAQVLCINHACDLALLSVEDPDFWLGGLVVVVAVQGVRVRVRTLFVCLRCWGSGAGMEGRKEKMLSVKPGEGGLLVM